MRLKLRKVIKHDFSVNGWGHSIHEDWGAKNPQPDGSYKVSGCCTPLPKKGDIAIMKDGSEWTFKNVEYMCNPPDGFFAEMLRKS